MKNSTYLQFIIDRSGSMHEKETDVIGGFNAFVEEQKKDHTECRVGMVQFNGGLLESFSDVALPFVAPLTHASYVTSGSTALLDAMGATIQRLGTRLAALPESERPRNVVVITMTDGEENCSREYRIERIREMIKHQTEKYNWTFVFIGADIDAFTIGRGLGISLQNVAKGQNTSKGIHAYYQATSHAVLRSRGIAAKGEMLRAQAFFTDDEKKQIETGDSNSQRK